MRRLASPTCLVCSSWNLLRLASRSNTPQPSILQPWLQRQARTSARRKPARMELSARVGSSKSQQTRNVSPRLSAKVAGSKPSSDRNASAGSEPRRSPRGDTPRKNFNELKALKMNRSLDSMSHRARDKIRSGIEDIVTFENFVLLPAIQEAIKKTLFDGLEYATPTAVQKVAIPKLLVSPTRRKKPDDRGTQSFLIAGETGSGKTLAYLLPLVDAIKRAEVSELEAKSQQEEMQRKERESRQKRSVFYLDPPEVTRSRNPAQSRPRVIILVPSKELVQQLQSVAKSISHIVKIRVAGISTLNTTQVIRNKLFRPDGIDLVISTPHLLSSIVDGDPNILSRVSHLVIDEADSLFDRSFAPITSRIIDRASPSLEKLIFCSATIPRSLDSFLRNRYPDTDRLITPKLHKISRRVPLGVIDVNQGHFHGNKDLACASLIYDRVQAIAARDTVTNEVNVDHIIVFVNEREKATQLAEYLTSKGIRAAAFNQNTRTSELEEWLESFKSRNPLTMTLQRPSSDSPAALLKSKRELPNAKVLVTTDLGSRGLDTLACRLVILYDIPHTSIDFIHRLGRVGRMGRRGDAVAIVGSGDRRDIVREVRDTIFKGQPLI